MEDLEVKMNSKKQKYKSKTEARKTPVQSEMASLKKSKEVSLSKKSSLKEIDDFDRKVSLPVTQMGEQKENDQSPL